MLRLAAIAVRSAVVAVLLEPHRGMCIEEKNMAAVQLAHDWSWQGLGGLLGVHCHDLMGALQPRQTLDGTHVRHTSENVKYST